MKLGKSSVEEMKSQHAGRQKSEDTQALADHIATMKSGDVAYATIETGTIRGKDVTEKMAINRLRANLRTAAGDVKLKTVVRKDLGRVLFSRA